MPQRPDTFWEAKDVSAAKGPLILSKLLERWRDSWLQMQAEVDSGSFIDANPKAEAEPFDGSGRPPVFGQRVHIQRWQSYAPIQETIFRRHETGLLVASSEYSTGPHEWYHAGQYYQEDTSISLEMLPKAPHEFHRKARKGRLTRTKEWLTNHRNSSRLSFTSPISSRSSRTSPSPPFSSPPGSPLPCRDSYCSELPDSTRCELADTSIVIENPTSLCQASLSAGSVPPQYSDSGEVKSNQNGFECAVQDICPSSETECQIYQSSPVSNVDSCTSPSLNRATNLDNGDLINQLNPHPLKDSLPLVVNCFTWEINAMRDTETLPSYDPQKDDSTETQLREKGRIYDSVYLEKSNHESPQGISNHANGQNGGSNYGSGIKSNSSYPSSTSISGNGGDRHGRAGYGNCDDSENNSQDEDDDGDNNRKRKRFRHLSPGSGQRQFACVYHKYDPETYHGDHDRKYLTCSGTSFKFFSLLTRHLSRTHDEHVCSSCFRTFESENLQASHTANCFVKLQCSQEDKWAALWRKRFPGVDMPESPYWEPTFRSMLPRLNTHADGFFQQDWDASGSANTCDPSPSNWRSSKLQPHCVGGDSQPDPNAASPMAAIAMLQSTVERQRIQLEAFAKQVSFLTQLQLGCFTAEDASNKPPAYPLVSPAGSSSISPNGNISENLFVYSNFEHPGETAIPDIRLGQPTPSSTPTEEATGYNSIASYDDDLFIHPT
ncbi:hypothetical protein HCBG_04541 [Histoplasma capsulatum G186AR]|uniref:Uncharacterized protein n=1 Tax=Ajellomyces capsulatus (strain G186AR / H82 / ATCC MYA-2454 / RMSCC 2432) TaxID=447093 RepID=C0NM11_AJECG|nr:uncharacterized protein HCBG_04541 [Histoplasma capsulatum G186AR]EEH07662.1 hypothetical protein HCBG_04541 [Histoplasma capsulatum G186AR]